jgi:hypothetical protein
VSLFFFVFVFFVFSDENFVKKFSNFVEQKKNTSTSKSASEPSAIISPSSTPSLSHMPRAVVDG